MTREDFEEYLKTDEGQELIPHIDRLKTAAIRTYRENHPVIEADQEPDLAAKEAEILSLKIQNQVMRECHRRDIPEDFLEDCGIEFQSLEEIEPRMERIAGRFESLKAARSNAELAASFKPGGAVHVEPASIGEMSEERALFLEQIGALDDVIRDKDLV